MRGFRQNCDINTIANTIVAASLNVAPNLGDTRPPARDKNGQWDIESRRFFLNTDGEYRFDGPLLSARECAGTLIITYQAGMKPSHDTVSTCKLYGTENPFCLILQKNRAMDIEANTRFGFTPISSRAREVSFLAYSLEEEYYESDWKHIRAKLVIIDKSYPQSLDWSWESKKMQ